MTITVHHLNNSRSQRILWLLEELGADYEIVSYQRDATTNLAPASLKDAHPLGKSPLIEDNGRSIAESGAIIQYLCERHGGETWLPDLKSDAHIDHLEWMQFGESSFFVPVMLKLYAGRLGEAAALSLEDHHQFSQFFRGPLFQLLGFPGDLGTLDIQFRPETPKRAGGHGNRAGKCRG